MASFCRQCSIDIWGYDDKDWAGQSTPEDTAKGLFCQALCEDCGPCLVDHEGNCVSKDCDKKHGLSETRIVELTATDYPGLMSGTGAALICQELGIIAQLNILIPQQYTEFEKEIKEQISRELVKSINDHHTYLKLPKALFKKDNNNG